MNQTTVALGGTLAVLIFLAAFDKTAPWAMGLLIFMLVVALYFSWSSGSLGNAMNAAFGQQENTQLIQGLFGKGGS